MFRKGAAYGLAGVVKGLKISSVNGFGILDSLKASLEEKVSPCCICDLNSSDFQFFLRAMYALAETAEARKYESFFFCQ